MDNGFCRYSESMEFYRITPDNAEQVLDAIGFGRNRCLETNSIDGRYGNISQNGIEFGFAKSMHGFYKFGNYIVYDDEDIGWRYLSDGEFNESYTIIN